MNLHSVFSLVASAVCVLCCNQISNAQKIDFEAEIQPLLEEKCWHCHGEDEQESGLRLDLRTAMLRGGDSGLAAR